MKTSFLPTVKTSYHSKEVYLMKSFKAILAAFIAVAAAVAVFSGCAKKEEESGGGGNTAVNTPAPDAGASGGEQATPAPDAAQPVNDTLVIGVTEFNGIFNELYYNTAYDKKIINATGLFLLDTGPGGALIDGAAYYQTPELVYNGDGSVKETLYTFKLREGLVFSDGEPVTADDVVFTYKAMVSPAYSGLGALHTVPIRGVMEYRYDDPNYAAKLKEIETESQNIPDDEVRAAAREMAVADYDAAGYGPAGLIGDLELEIEAAEGSDGYKDEVIEKATEAYFNGYYDYFKGGLVTEKEKRLTLEYVAGNVAGGEKVKDIAGIKKLDDLTVQVTIEGVSRTAEIELGGILVLPEHYYGAGITKADFEAARAKNSAPMGGGPYLFENFQDNVVTLRANPTFFRGEPAVKIVKYQVIASGEEAQAVASGIVDVSEVSCTAANVEALESAGKYAYIYDRNGWGYVGVSGKMTPDINIRKGLMHAMNRDLGVRTYYGDLAAVLERPITMASWGYPEGDNERVYEYDLAKAKEYFAAAGYAEKDGKLVDKDGKQLSFTVYYPQGDHPVVPLYTQMKNDLEAMGVVFEISTLNWASVSDLMTTGEATVWAAAYGDGSPDPDCYQMFHTDSIAAQNNPYYCSDPELDKLIDDGKLILDIEAAKKHYEKVYRKVMETATVAPYYQRMEMMGINPDKIDITSLVQEPDPFYNFDAALLEGKLRLK
jgi:peptide/nickel transport system substrate-binding protein